MVMAQSIHVLLILVLHYAYCRIFDFDIHHDTRQSIVVNTFGHSSRGVLNLTVTEFGVHLPKKISIGDSTEHHYSKNNNIGFIYKRITSDESAQHESYFRGLFIHNQNERTCYDNLRSSVRAMDAESIIIPVTQAQVDIPIIVRVPNGKKGLYGLFYYNCEQKKELVVVPVSMHIHVEQYNEILRESSDSVILEPGRDYLTVGESPLSIIYMSLSGCFSLLTLLGAIYIIKERKNVFKIHVLMVILSLLKSASLFFEGARFHYLQLNGIALEWSVMYYIFTIFKGIMMFIVVLLLATGWSFIKSFLTSFEKRVLFGVLSLQVFSNIGTIVMEQTADGNPVLNTWRQVLNWVDLVCIVLVLPVISWSIRNLRNASTTDGKAIHNATRLSQFQLLYLIVFGYSYFTRILTTFMKTKLNHNFAWMPDLINELLTLSVFIFTGYQFRPVKIQEYMSDEDEESRSEDRYALHHSHKPHLRIRSSGNTTVTSTLELGGDNQPHTGSRQQPVFGWVYSVLEYFFTKFKKLM